MYLEVNDNNGKKYIRVCETRRIRNAEHNRSKVKKVILKNIGPVSRFDDGKPDFVERLKASYAAGTPIIDELVPYVNKDVKKVKNSDTSPG